MGFALSMGLTPLAADRGGARLLAPEGQQPPGARRNGLAGLVAQPTRRCFSAVRAERAARSPRCSRRVVPWYSAG